MSEWQPIETAPRDGTLIIGARLLRGQPPEAYCIQWVYEELVDEEEGYDPDDYYAGWCVADDPTSEEYPTHWMPLPEAPK